MKKCYKIAILGPESTGKSTLSKELANRLGATLVPEYARYYVASLGRPYTYEDVCHIAEQNRAEISSEFESAVAIFDTELIVTKVWLEEVYHRMPDWISSPIPSSCRADVYLLLSPDIPWESDPVRENGSEEARQRLFEKYEKEVRATGSPYAVIKGTGHSRTMSAYRFLTELCGLNVGQTIQ